MLFLRWCRFPITFRANCYIGPRTNEKGEGSSFDFLLSRWNDFFLPQRLFIDDHRLLWFLSQDFLLHDDTWRLLPSMTSFLMTAVYTYPLWILIMGFQPFISLYNSCTALNRFHLHSWHKGSHLILFRKIYLLIIATDSQLLIQIRIAVCRVMRTLRTST